MASAGQSQRRWRTDSISSSSLSSCYSSTYHTVVLSLLRDYLSHCFLVTTGHDDLAVAHVSNLYQRLLPRFLSPFGVYVRLADEEFLSDPSWLVRPMYRRCWMARYPTQGHLILRCHSRFLRASTLSCGLQVLMAAWLSIIIMSAANSAWKTLHLSSSLNEWNVFRDSQYTPAPVPAIILDPSVKMASSFSKGTLPSFHSSLLWILIENLRLQFGSGMM